MLSDAKREMRAWAIRVRDGAAPDCGARLGDRIRATTLMPPPGAVVAGFWPLPGEIDIRPLLRELHAGGHPVLLPQTPSHGQGLIFRLWTPETPMILERFGTFRPDGPLGTPEVLLVPLLAFDAGCNRLGYGGGYYDRTIAALPGVRTIGCAFSVQQVDAVPVLPHDVPLDAVATERGVILRES